MGALWLLTAWQIDLDPVTRALLIAALLSAILALYCRAMEP